MWSQLKELGPRLHVLLWQLYSPLELVPPSAQLLAAIGGLQGLVTMVCLRRGAGMSVWTPHGCGGGGGGAP